jgi:Zn-finger nucleic acid-binding protein
MQCPNDNTTLQMTTREGIEIDYCPQCRGVWLDRGELDKLIERSNLGGQQGYQQPQHQQFEQREPRYEERRSAHHHDDDDDDYKHQGHGGHNQKHHKKEGFLGDLFDF